MKVLLHDYGGYAFTLQLAEFLADSGNDVTYIHGGFTQTVQRFGDSYSREFQRAVSIESIKLSKPFAKYSFVRRWLQEREYGTLLAEKITEAKPDIIISANSPLDVQQLALRAARTVEGKFVFWWQDVISLAMQRLLTQKYKAIGWFIGKYYRAMERSLLCQSQKVISISDDFLEIARSWGISKDNMRILPNWAPLRDIPVLPKKNAWARSQHLQDKFVFLYSGILGLKHNPRVFIQLAKHFLPIRDVVIVVISDGPGSDWLRTEQQNQALHNLLILPFQPYEELPYALASADVLLSVLDTQAGTYSVPSKVLTYFCSGRPVLLSAPLDNLAARIVQKQEAGLVAPTENIDLFCKYAEELHHCIELRRSYGENARAYAESNFDINTIGTRFLECIV